MKNNSVISYRKILYLTQCKQDDGDYSSQN